MSPPTSLRGTMHLLNGTLDVVTMFSWGSVGHGCLCPFTASTIQTSFARLMHAGGSGHRASVHVHVCIHCRSVNQEDRKIWVEEGGYLHPHCEQGKLLSRVLTQQVSSSNYCRSLVTPPPPPFPSHAKWEHYNDEAERQRERDEMRWWDGGDNAARRLNWRGWGDGGGGVNHRGVDTWRQLIRMMMQLTG